MIIIKAFDRALKYFLIYLLTFLPVNILVASKSYANIPGQLPVVADGSTNTVVTRAANGVNVVNIATPDGGGVSRNNFSDYNVDRAGLVINNAAVDRYSSGIVNTGIAGLILTNPNLNEAGGANVILNQVTSNRITRIDGYTEVAGQRADLIIANPNGIMINSGGFINTDRLSMIVGREVVGTGSGVVNNGDLRFRLTSAPHLESGFLPELTISGAGIDLTRVAQTEFVANLIRLTGEAGVYAGDNDVRFLTGDGEYGYQANAVASVAVDGDGGGASQIAIDASSLSQIQAGNIFMVASKEGFGVKYSGLMLANLGDINVTAAGDIEFEDFIGVSRDFSAVSGGDLAVDGSDIVATGNVALDGQDVTVIGDSNVVADGGVALTGSGNLTVDSSHIEAVNVEMSFENGDTLLESFGSLSNNFSLLSGGNIDVEGSSIILSDEINLNSGGNIVIDSSNLRAINEANLASRDLTISNGSGVVASNLLLNTNGADFEVDGSNVVAGEASFLNGRNFLLVNDSNFIVNGNVDIDFAGSINVNGSRIEGNNVDLNAAGVTVENNSVVVGSENVRLLSSNGILRVDESDIGFGNTLNLSGLNGVNVVNSSNIISDGGSATLASLSGDINVNLGYIRANGVNFDGRNILIGGSVIDSSSIDLDPNVGNITINSSDLIADDILISSTTNNLLVENDSNIIVTNGANIDITGDLRVNLSRIEGGSVALNAAGVTVENNSAIVGGEDVNVVSSEALRIDSSDVGSFNGDVALSSSNIVIGNSSNVIASAGIIGITSDTDIILDSSYTGASNLRLNSGRDIYLRNSSNVVSNLNASFASHGDFNLEASNIQSSRLRVDSGGIINIGNSNIISENVDFDSSAATSVRSSNIIADNLDFDVNGLLVEGDSNIVVTGDVNVDSNNYIRLNLSRIEGNDVTLDGAGVTIENNSVIVGSQDVTLNSSNDIIIDSSDVGFVNQNSSGNINFSSSNDIILRNSSNIIIDQGSVDFLSGGSILLDDSYIRSDNSILNANSIAIANNSNILTNYIELNSNHGDITINSSNIITEDILISASTNNFLIENSSNLSVGNDMDIETAGSIRINLSRIDADSVNLDSNSIIIENNSVVVGSEDVDLSSDGILRVDESDIGFGNTLNLSGLNGVNVVNSSNIISDGGSTTLASLSGDINVNLGYIRANGVNFDGRNILIGGSVIDSSSIDLNPNVGNITINSSDLIADDILISSTTNNLLVENDSNIIVTNGANIDITGDLRVNLSNIFASNINFNANDIKVENDSSVVAEGDINVNSNIDVALDMGNIGSFNGNISLTSGDEVIARNFSSVIADNGNIDFNSTANTQIAASYIGANDLNLAGSSIAIVAGANIVVNNVNLLSTGPNVTVGSSNIIADNLNFDVNSLLVEGDSNIIVTGDVDVDSSGYIRLNLSRIEGGSVALNAAGVTIENNSVIVGGEDVNVALSGTLRIDSSDVGSFDGDIILAANNINTINSSNLIANQGDVQINSITDNILDSSYIDANNLTINTGGNIYIRNSSEIITDLDVNLISGESVTLQASYIQSSGLNVNSGKAVNVNNSNILSENINFDSSGNTNINSSNIVSNNNLNFDITDLISANSNIIATENININSTGNVAVNLGRIEANRINIIANNVVAENNSNIITSQDVEFILTGDFTADSSNIGSFNGNILLSANNIAINNSSNVISSTGDVEITSNENIIIDSSYVETNILTANSAGGINLISSYAELNELNIDSSDTSIANSDIFAEDINLNSSNSISIISSDIIASNDLNFDANNLSIEARSNIVATGDFDANTTGNININLSRIENESINFNANNITIGAISNIIANENISMTSNNDILSDASNIGSFNGNISLTSGDEVIARNFSSVIADNGNIDFNSTANTQIAASYIGANDLNLAGSSIAIVAGANIVVNNVNLLSTGPNVTVGSSNIIADNLNFDVNSLLVEGDSNIIATGDVNVDSSGYIRLNLSRIEGNNVDLNAAGVTVENNSVVVGSEDVDLSSDGILRVDESDIGFGNTLNLSGLNGVNVVNSSNIISDGGSATLASLSGDINVNLGYIRANGVNFDGRNILIGGSVIDSSSIDLNPNIGNITINSSDIITNNLSITPTVNYLLVENNSNIDLINANDINFIVNGDFRINLSNIFTNQANITANNIFIENDSNIIARNNVNLNSNNQIHLNSGNIRSYNDLNLAANLILVANNSKIITDQNSSINSTTDIITNLGYIRSGNLNFNSNRVIFANNSNIIGNYVNINPNSGNITANSSNIIAQNINIDQNTNNILVENESNIVIANDFNLNINGNVMVNLSNIFADDINFNSNGHITFENSSNVISQGESRLNSSDNIRLDSANISASGLYLVGNNLNIVNNSNIISDSSVGLNSTATININNSDIRSNNMFANANIINLENNSNIAAGENVNFLTTQGFINVNYSNIRSNNINLISANNLTIANNANIVANNSSNLTSNTNLLVNNANVRASTLNASANSVVFENNSNLVSENIANISSFLDLRFTSSNVRSSNLNLRGSRIFINDNSNIVALGANSNFTSNTDIEFNLSDATLSNITFNAKNTSFVNFSNAAIGNATFNITGDIDNNSRVAIDQSSKILSTTNTDRSSNTINMTSNDRRTGVDFATIANSNRIDFINNGQIISENGLSIISDGNISLLANSVLSSANETYVESRHGNIRNIPGAEIITGGSLTLSAINGLVGQYSRNSVSVDGNHIISAASYTNTGRVDISGDLTMNITNDLINEAGALIYAGNDMFLNIGNNLINNQNAAIYAGNNLTIRKLDPTAPGYDANNNNLNQIDNIAGTIESGRSILINASALNNTGIDYDPDTSGFFGYNINYLVHRGGHGENFYNLMQEDQAVSTLRTIQAFISSGENITINNANVHNYSSSITAQGNISINNGSLNNETSSRLVTGLRRQYGKHWRTKHHRCNWRRCSHYEVDHWHDYWQTYDVNIRSSENANIKAGGNFTLNGVNQINNGYLNNSLGAQILVTNPLLITDILDTGAIAIDFSEYFTDISAQSVTAQTESITAQNSASLSENRSINSNARNITSQVGNQQVTRSTTLNTNAAQTQQITRSGSTLTRQTTSQNINSAATNIINQVQNQGIANNVSSASQTQTREIATANSNTANQETRNINNTTTNIASQTGNRQITSNTATANQTETTTIPSTKSSFVSQSLSLQSSAASQQDSSSSDSSSSSSSSTTTTIYYGLFQRSDNPNSPLFESRSQFVDQSQFFASNYFYNAIGVNLEDLDTQLQQNNQRLIGDQFFQAKNVEKQLKNIAKNSYLLSESEIDPNQEMKNLIDNAAEESERLGLSLNESLTQNQIDSLQKDILWYEVQEIEGDAYIVPKIYLTQASRDRLKDADGGNKGLTDGSLIFARNDLSLTSSTGSIANDGSIFAGSDVSLTSSSGSITNNGSIFAGNDLTLDAYQDIINNNDSEITAQGDLAATSSAGSIINRSVIAADSDASGAGDLTLTAANNIFNLATVETNAQNLLDETFSISGDGGDTVSAYVSNGLTASNVGTIRSSLLETASLSGRNVTINAGKDFTNVGANVTATGNLAIIAGDDVNIESVKLRTRDEHRWRFKKRSGIIITDTTTNVGSDIVSGGNLTLTSGDDANIIGSNVTVAGNANIETVGDLNILAAQDLYYKYEASSKKGSFGRGSSGSSTTNRVTNIASNFNVGGDITSNSQENINIIASNVTSSGGDIGLVAGLAINIAAGQDTNYVQNTSSKKGTTIIKSATDIAYDVTNVHSDLTAAGDISLTSGTDTNLVGTNLEAGNNIVINAGDELMIAAVADTSYRYSDSSKSRSMATVAKYTGVSAALKTAELVTDTFAFATQPLTEVGFNPVAATTSGMVNYIQNLAEGDLNSKIQSNVTQTRTYQLAKLEAGNDLNIISNSNIDLIGTDIDAVDAVITSTVGDVNIANVKDSSYSKSTIQKSKVNTSSLATDAVKTATLAASTFLTANLMVQHPDAKKQTIEENEEAMGQKSQKQFTGITSSTDETVVASTIDVNSLIINSGRDTIITSSDINTIGDLDVNSVNNTTIASDFENDSSFTLTEKKNPNAVAALSNGLVKVVGDAMPDFSFKKPDDKEQTQEQQRENDSLDHNPHSQDIGVATNTNDAMINGYTVSNNGGDELAYDTDLDKKTIITKTYVASNITSGGDIDIDSTNGNNTVIASNVTADGDININATNGETLITSATNESFIATSHVEQDYNDISMNYDRGRASVDARTSIYEKDSKNTTTTQVGSVLTSGGSINVNSKDDIDILSSDLNSNNEINLASTEGNTNIAANKNTQRSETEIREGTLTLSAGVGHVAVDAAYAADDTVKAAENLKKAKENLSRIKRLQKEGRATKDAVDDAEANLAVAGLNVTLAGLKMLSAAEKVDKTKYTLGFYGDAKLIRTGDKTNITSDSSQEVASNLIAVNDINIDSGSALTDPDLSDVGNTNIKGNIQSVNADVNITSFNDTNIIATKSESSSSMKTEGFTETVILGASHGNSPTDELIYSITAEISKRTGKSDSSNVNYTNTNIIANNGAININSTNNDTNISGANLAANDITINSGGDLNVESLQNTSRSKSKSQSIGVGGGNGSGSLSYSSNRSSFERDWVDDQTEIVANNALRINTDGNTDVKGAVIASNDNDLIINTATLTYSDIIDTEKQESSGFGISTNISLGEGSRNPNANNPNQDKGYYPNGSTSLSMNNSGYEKEQITRATIGAGVINITNEANQLQDISNLNRDMDLTQEITKDTITGALDVAMTVDNRIIGAFAGSDGARGSLNESINVGSEKLLNGDVLEANAILIDEALELAGKAPVVGEISRQVTSPVEGVIDYFYENDTKLYARVNGKVRELTREEALVFEKYAVNGIMTPKEKMIANYLTPEENNIVVRHNPSSGFLGDLIESGLGKTLGEIAPDTSKMVREVREDLYARRDLGDEGGSIERYNVFHSQGSIIGEGAMRSYINNYGNKGDNKINSSQVFVAVGPAVSEGKWENSVNKLNKKIENVYEHDKRDPVRYTASPSATSLLIGDIARGIYHGKDMDKHDVRGNYDYAHYLMSKSYIDKHNLPTPEDRRNENLLDPRTKIESHPFYKESQNKNNTQ